MGWGQGIGIGWPNASASAGPPVVMGYFQITQFCNGDTPENLTSQLVNTSLYNTGDSVFGTFSGPVNYQAVTLGSFTSNPGEQIFEISGPSYTTCPVYYEINQRCDGGDIKGWTTIPLSGGTYNSGEYVYSETFNTIVLLGSPRTTPLDQQITVTGPIFEACQVSYDVSDCIQDQPYTTGYYNAGTFGNGDRVYTEAGNYGYINTSVEPQEGNINTEAFPIGYVDYRCNDCNVYLSPTLNNGYNENYQYYMDLTAFEQANQVQFASNDNALNVNVNYYIYFEANEDPPISRSGNVQFVIPSYNITAGTSALLDSQFIFNVPEGKDYHPVQSNIFVTSMSVDNTEMGPYDTGWNYDNKYVTSYGNVWTFYYPNNE